MFDSFLGFGDQVLTGAMLIVSAGVSSHIMFGYGTRRGKEAFIGLVLCLAVGIQMYYLINASIVIQTTKFETYNPLYRRSDCTKSNKGGKRPTNSKNHYDLNPCFCHTNATCVDATTNGTAKCFSNNNNNNNRKEIELYVSDKRNCEGGSGPTCTINDPCYPCALDTLYPFLSGRCQQCTTDNPGDCHFVPNVGPYCYETPGSRKVGPCKKCCTPATPVFVNGQCY